MQDIRIQLDIIIHLSGVSAGYSNTTGYYNSFIGVSAGRYIADGVTANSTANNFNFIGGNTKLLADNQTNQIAIGHNAPTLGPIQP